MRARKRAGARARGLPPDGAAGRYTRARRSGCAGGGDRRAHGGRLGHGGEQRDRRAAADRRDRRAVPCPRRAVPQRRGAGGRQGAGRCRRHEHRPAVDLRPQDLRPQRHRRALCAAPAAGAPGAAVRRRRAGAGPALRHIAGAEMAAEAERLLGLRRRFLAAIQARLPELRLNGDPERRLPGNLNLSFPGAPALALMQACPGLALSTGSACTAVEVEPSYVLRALGVPEALAAASLRLGLGRYTTDSEVDFAVDALAAAAQLVAARERVTAAEARPT